MTAVPELRIYGDIGDVYDGGVTAAGVAAQLDAITADHLTVRINSGGGSAWDGIAIHNAIVRHPARTTVHIDGLAASAASLIAMAGDEILIASNGRIMIHDAALLTFGTADRLAADARQLDSLSATYADVYAARAGGTPAQWRDVMRRETWYTAEQALAAGLVDRIEGRATVPAASLTGRPNHAAAAAAAGRARARAIEIAVAVARARRTRRSRTVSQLKGHP